MDGLFQYLAIWMVSCYLSFLGFLDYPYEMFLLGSDVFAHLDLVDWIVLAWDLWPFVFPSFISEDVDVLSVF